MNHNPPPLSSASHATTITSTNVPDTMDDMIYDMMDDYISPLKKQRVLQQHFCHLASIQDPTIPPPPPPLPIIYNQESLLPPPPPLFIAPSSSSSFISMSYPMNHRMDVHTVLQHQ